MHLVSGEVLVLSEEVLVIAVEQVRTMPALRRAVVFTESGMQGFF